MKNKILVLLFLIISTISFAQERVNALEFKKKYTIAQRDALSLGANDRVLIYVVDTGVNELQIWDGDSWETLGGGGGLTNPLTEDLNLGTNEINNVSNIVSGGGEFSEIAVDNITVYQALNMDGNPIYNASLVTVKNPVGQTTDVDNYSLETINGNLILKANGGSNGSAVPLLTFNSSTLQTGFGNYEFPRQDGTAGQILTTDGNGNVTFEDVAGGYNITADDITIPSTIYACVGFETNIYYDALIPCFDNGLATKTNVEIICAKGQSFQDRWALTATSPDVGTETMTINVYDDNNNLIATKSVSLNIVEDSGDSISANILMVGDSLTFAGTITSTLRTSLLTFTGITPTFYGSQGTSPNNQEGRAGWAFSSFVGATSPFYNGGVIDIANYRSSVLSSAPQFDIVIIQLGVNDSFDNNVKSTAEITAILDDAKTLIDAFIADNSDSKIIVQLPTLCANTLDGWADDYDATRKRNNYKKNIFLLRKAILNDFDLGAYNTNVSVGQAGLSVDRYYGYPRSSGNPATRLTGDTVERHTNALHPTEGYPQIADGILGQVLSFIEYSGTSLGPELIINGDFSSSPMSYANGWFTIDSGVRIENNQLWLEDLATNCRAYATNGTNLEMLTQTKSYRLEYTVFENLDNAQLECYYDGVYNEVPDVVGTHVVTFTQNSTSKSFIFSNQSMDSGKIIKIDNVSLKEIL